MDRKDFFNRYWKEILIIILIFALFFYFLLHLLFVFMFVCVLVVVVIGLFEPKKIKYSLKSIIIFIFLLGLVSSPILLGASYEYYRLNNPRLIVKIDDPWIEKLASEFGQSSDFSSNQLNKLGAFVEHGVPYKDNLFNLLPIIFSYHPISDIKKKGGGDCSGRALVAYGIVKKLGYEKVYIAASFPDHHLWIRVYENGDYKEFFNYYKSDVYLLFNEHKALWGNEIQELKKLLFFGFRPDSFGLNFMFSLLFFIPVGFWLISFFIFTKKKNFRKFIILLCSIFLMALLSVFFSILVFERIISIFMLAMSGLTLRIFYYFK